MGGFLSPGRRQAGLVLLCFHHAGGGASLFHGWQEHLGPEISVWPVLLPGRERRVREARYTDIADLVHDLATELSPELERPYAIFGHSMGALIAYRFTALRLARGERPPSAVYLSACAPPDSPRDDLPRDACDQQLLDWLIALGGIPTELLSHPQLLELSIPVLRDDLHLCRPRVDLDAPALTCPVHVFGGAHDRLVTAGSLREWKEVSNCDPEPVLFEGGHFYLSGGHPELMKKIRSSLVEGGDTE
ncbi:alpha/beta fold hydrolase [Lipingzhangella sp. LS1_29]|uniref:Alpha/beta fold hydrolase n=1 Tax=Lipingzhangella rawalii TaxID=2055835 RepID=A0ABU2H7G0_9ACTN|nr:alpha/beta fold hydrolase [Lipingzhangella rawalii]MDS1270917.1 alpha/beta fold hydrolase [Lipingzhangella rawalii]